MTQEELDALMNEDIESVELDETVEETPREEMDLNPDPEEFRVDAASNWPPPPPTSEHQMVHQLDEVTEDSEKKAGEVFDILEAISSEGDTIESGVSSVKNSLSSIEDTFKMLNEKFPNIEAFKTELENINTIQTQLEEVTGSAQNVVDQTMMAMDVMQYQDIHRQKIERVINVMRALSHYMNSLFAGKKDDDKRVGSAKHLEGDSADIVGEEDIEALIASFGTK
jgi:hypothetical protein